jgi:dihydroorotase
MTSLLILNGKIVSDGQRSSSDIFINNGRIEAVSGDLQSKQADTVLDAGGKLVIPGLIDDQVHFRDPGLTSKGDLHTESIAAVAGGVTSFMEMPNTNPQTVTADALISKFKLAAEKSVANYTFYLGATNDNLEEIRNVDKSLACGIKVFMGASTGNMLVDNPQTLEGIFRESPLLVATHCEDTPTITSLENEYRDKYGDNVPWSCHADIRGRGACIKSSALAVELAQKHGARLHLLHLSTAEEMDLLSAGPLSRKRITGEVCVHHLYFCQDDYDELGARIKWNPSIKTSGDRDALRKAVRENKLDVIATDHAPHLLNEKENNYWNCPSGGPLVQHSLPALLEMSQQGAFSLETMIQKACHAPAELFQIKERGYIREGYWADIVIVDGKKPLTAGPDNVLYKCGWCPFDGHTFPSSVHTTIINGQVVYANGKVNDKFRGQKLAFTRD